MKMKKIFLIIIATFFIFSINVSARPVINDHDTNFGYVSSKVSCGNVTDIPRKIPELTSMGMTMIQIAVPVILVIMGSMDLFKGITAQKEDEIKKGQQIFVKRLVIGALIFFVVVIAKLLISVVADASSANIIKCIDCFLSNICS